MAVKPVVVQPPTEGSIDVDEPAHSGFQVEDFAIASGNLKNPNSPFHSPPEGSEEAAIAAAIRKLVPEALWKNVWVLCVDLFAGTCDQIFSHTDYMGLSRQVKEDFVTKTRTATKPFSHFVICVAPHGLEYSWFNEVGELWSDFLTEKHPLPMCVCRDAEGSVSIDLYGKEPPHTLFNNQYAVYNGLDEAHMAEMYARRKEANPPPVVFPRAGPSHMYKIPFTGYAEDLRVMEAIFKLGIKCDQFQNSRELEQYTGVKHRAIGVKARDKYQKPGKPKGSNQTKVQSQEAIIVNTMAWVFVRLDRRDIDDEVVPPEGTSFVVDPVDETGGMAGSDDNDEYKGIVVDHPYTREMGADLCLAVRVPRKGRLILKDNFIKAKKLLKQKKGLKGVYLDTRPNLDNPTTSV